MTIEQHAEAAVREYWDAANKADGHGKAMTHYIAKHMQSAIDEALAEKMISVLDNASNHVHEVDLLKARIAALEGLGPLIDLYGSSSWNDGYTAAEGQRRTNTKNETKAKIDAILKGES